MMPLTRWHNATWVNSKQVGSAGGRCKLPQRGPGRSPGRKRILEHFPAKETHLVTGGSNFVSKRR